MMQWVENNEKNNSWQSNLILPEGSEEEGWGSFSTITMHNIDNGKQKNNN